MTVTSGEDKKKIEEREIDLTELDRLDEMEDAERRAAEPHTVRKLKSFRASLFERVRSKFR